MKFILGLLIFFVTLTSFAFAPLRDPKKLKDAKTEKVLPVRTARVMTADYTLIRRDFGEVEGLSNDEIDVWLIRNAAFISSPQAAQTKVNTQIEVGEQAQIAYRPAEYGRSLVLRTEGGGLIDVKGSGAVNPATGDHANGLASLGEGLREFIFEKMIRKILTFVSNKYETVECYAVIDLGFNIKQVDKDGIEHFDRAGLILRQAHERFYNPSRWRKKLRALFPAKDQIAIERILRRYGITSVLQVKEDEKDKTMETMNIQGTTSMAVVDFGSYHIMRSFDRSVIYTPIQGEESEAIIALQRRSRDFIQPDPLFRLPYSIWGSSVSGKDDPAFDNPYLWSHETAAAFAAGTAQRQDVENHIRNFLGPVDHILKLQARRCENAL